MDLKNIAADDLCALEDATAGRLSSTLDVLMRVHGADHMDVQVMERRGSFWIVLTGLDVHDERTVGGYYLPIDDDGLDDEGKRAVVALHLACVVERGRKQERQIRLRSGVAATSKKPLP